MNRTAILALAAVTLLLSAGCSMFQQTGSRAVNPSTSNAPSGASSESLASADRAAPIYEPMPMPRPRPANPNGEPFDSMYFKHAGTNPFISTEDDTLSTFALDVDTGSFSIVRNYIANGVLPPEDAVRVEEFINYFTPSYPAPKEGETFRIYSDGGPSPFGEGYHLLRVGLKAKEIPDSERLPANLTIVIDLSGSMERDNRIGLVKQSLHVLIDSLKPSDQIAIVGYGSDARIVLEPVSLEETSVIKDRIEQLKTGGSTYAEQGLKLAYELAERQWDANAINRVILLSDGVANLGETSAEGILESIRDHASQGITLTTVGFGMGNYNDILMEQLANQGNGVYAYVDSFTEARRLFNEDLTSTLQTVAKDARIQIEFDADTVDRYRLIGYENRDMDDEDFRNDEKDAGEIGAGHTVTALYEVKIIEGAPEDAPIATATVRYIDEETKEVREQSAPLRLSPQRSDELQFFAAVAEYAEILRGSYWAKDGSMEEVLKLAERTASGEREQQFVTLVKDTMLLMEQKHKK